MVVVLCSSGESVLTQDRASGPPVTTTYHGFAVAAYLRVFITALIMRVKSAFKNGLFRRHGEGGLLLLDHLAHFADAFGALRRALVAGEDVLRAAGAPLDGESDITLAETVTVANVQGEAPGT
ncbi:hypothetical protein H9656_06045 [Brevundimonas sp. Sa3CVA3]|jgi:hypothetical protein|uniref:Uncharacterized protein n=1 Tax=Brevundimonas guildfordensis TaxID=2762241 RepID=A0ABR8QZI5_9CAUL|nr:hypothetical protein [Brevundimonas guildfordensis]